MLWLSKFEDVDQLIVLLSQVMYELMSGKPHGRVTIADGSIDSESIMLNYITGATSEFQHANSEPEENVFWTMVAIVGERICLNDATMGK